MIEDKLRPEYKVFSHENGLKCSKKVDIFSENGCFSKKRSSLLRSWGSCCSVPLS